MSISLKVLNIEKTVSLCQRLVKQHLSDDTDVESILVAVELLGVMAKQKLTCEQSATQPKCRCHDRDGSYTCDYCKSQGFYGHMERKPT